MLFRSQNVIAMDSLGTPSTAAFVPSLITAIVMFALIFVWLEVRARSFTKKGIVFDDPSLKYQLSPEELPNPDEEKDAKNPKFHYGTIIAKQWYWYQSV